MLGHRSTSVVYSTLMLLLVVLCSSSTTLVTAAPVPTLSALVRGRRPIGVQTTKQAVQQTQPKFGLQIPFVMPPAPTAGTTTSSPLRIVDDDDDDDMDVDNHADLMSSKPASRPAARLLSLWLSSDEAAPIASGRSSTSASRTKPAVSDESIFSDVAPIVIASSVVSRNVNAQTQTSTLPRRKRSMQEQVQVHGQGLDLDSGIGGHDDLFRIKPKEFWIAQAPRRSG